MSVCACQSDLTSSWVNIFLMWRQQPSAMSMSSSYDRPLNTGWGALEKYLWKGKYVATSSTSTFLPCLGLTLLMYSSHRDITCIGEEDICHTVPFKWDQLFVFTQIQTGLSIKRFLALSNYLKCGCIGVHKWYFLYNYLTTAKNTLCTN